MQPSKTDDGVLKGRTVEAVHHLQLDAKVFLREVVKHPGVHQRFHESAAVLGQTYRRQPLVSNPLVVHIAEGQGLRKPGAGLGGNRDRMGLGRLSVHQFRLNSYEVLRGWW